MCKKMFYLVCFTLMLVSVGNAADIRWTDLGPDHLWSTPANWDLGTVPTPADEVRIDVPAAAAPNGPVIQEGIAAQAKGIFTEAAGESTLTMTGGSLVVADWIWWGDGPNSFPIWTMSGGTVTVTNEFELGWGGGGGTVIMTGGTLNAGEAVIPTKSGAFGHLFLNGGTYNVTKPGGLKVNARGLIDITAGTLVVEGDETAKINDLITAGQITAHGGSGKLNVDYGQSNAGKTTVTAVQKVIVLSEDFEGLPLGPNVDEALAGAQVWTDTPPAGWTIDDSGIPGIGNPATDGVTEWAGWAFANKDWWVQTAGDQRRSEFTLGQGTVAVADPDEWDDAPHPGPNSANPYDTWLSTPAVDISGVEAGSLQLKFDSSWRPEYDNNYHQTANITVSFDGAAPVEVLRWESNEASPNFKPDNSTNETVIVDLGNPAGAKSMVVTFGLFDAGNDWWWAIDNVEVSGNPLPGPAQTNLLANGGFEDGVLEPWNTYGNVTTEVVQQLVGAAVPEAPIEGKNCLHVVVPAAGANFWDAGLQHAGHVFKAGKKYTLSVWLKCKSGTLQINMKPELAQDPWTGFGEKVVTITDQWAQYSVTTPGFTQDTSPCSATFHIAFAAGEFWVDGAQLIEEDYVPPAGGANELTNGNFEEGPTMPLDTWAPGTWNVYGTHTMEVVSELTGAAVPQAPIEGTYCLHVTVPQAGANFWDVGLQHVGHTFKQGKKYTLSVWLKSKSGTLTVNMKPELGADPWTGFGERQVTMTDQWVEYSTTTPEFAQDTSPGTITFHIGFAAGDFWVDNVRWYEGDYVAP